jgi:hypothetical protein
LYNVQNNFEDFCYNINIALEKRSKEKFKEGNDFNNFHYKANPITYFIKVTYTSISIIRVSVFCNADLCV